MSIAGLWIRLSWLDFVPKTGVLWESLKFTFEGGMRNINVVDLLQEDFKCFLFREYLKKLFLRGNQKKLNNLKLEPAAQEPLAS